jgi:hypothetical protein
MTPAQLEALDEAVGAAQDLVEALQLCPILDFPELVRELTAAGALHERLKNELALQRHAARARDDGERENPNDRRESDR